MKMIFGAVLSLSLLLPHVQALVVHGGKAASNKDSEVPMIVQFTVGKGVLRCTNSNLGKGFIMYSHTPVNQRWSRDKLQADFRVHTSKNLVCVRYRAGHWEYDTNWADEADRASKKSWHYFLPALTDVLVARVDFTDDKVTSLKGFKFKHKGMNAGYQSGNLTIASIPQGFVTAGGVIYPFADTVAFVPTVPPPPSAAFPLNKYHATTGLFRCSDSTVGFGFLMFSQQAVNERWKKIDKTQNPFRQHTASNFVCIRYKNGNWQFDTNWADEPDRTSKQSWHDFTPKTTDMVIASVNFLTGKMKDLKGVNFRHKGMQMGYADGDLLFTSNHKKIGRTTNMTFTMNGTFIIDYHFPNVPVPITKVKVNRKQQKTQFTCSNHPGTNGFIMYSNSTIDKRFKLNTTKNPLAFSQKHYQFVCIRYNNSRWQYDENWAVKPRWVDFVPDYSDIVVASINFANGQIKRIQGTNVRYNGMQMGFAGGDFWLLTKGQTSRQKITGDRSFKILGRDIYKYTNLSAAISPFAPITTTTTTVTVARPNPFSTTTPVVPFFTTTPKPATR